MYKSIIIFLIHEANYEITKIQHIEDAKIYQFALPTE
jgi:hypothetical protein